MLYSLKFEFQIEEKLLNIHTVTFSGASNGTDIQQMSELYHAHPYIEWGIQTPHYGGGLFPDVGWVKELTSTGIALSAHMCYVRGLLEEASTEEVLSIVGWDAFDRIQINTHGSPHYTRYETYALLQSDLFKSKEIIFQVDDVPTNLSTFSIATEMGINASGLFDTSHGSGTLPNTWPNVERYPKGKFGYSGGLGPDNMSAALPAIAEAAGDRDIWIDMEGKIRTHGNIDLDKIRRVIDSVENSGFLKRMDNGTN